MIILQIRISAIESQTLPLMRNVFLLQPFAVSENKCSWQTQGVMFVLELGQRHRR